MKQRKQQPGVGREHRDRAERESEDASELDVAESRRAATGEQMREEERSGHDRTADEHVG